MLRVTSTGRLILWKRFCPVGCDALAVRWRIHCGNNKVSKKLQVYSYLKHSWLYWNVCMKTEFLAKVQTLRPMWCCQSLWPTVATVASRVARHRGWWSFRLNVFQVVSNCLSLNAQERWRWRHMTSATPNDILIIKLSPWAVISVVSLAREVTVKP